MGMDQGRIPMAHDLNDGQRAQFRGKSRARGQVPSWLGRSPGGILGLIVAGCMGAADFQGDGSVDATDVSLMTACKTGSGVSAVSGCEAADLDGDGDVDQSDFGALQTCISGTNVTPPSGCS